MDSSFQVRIQKTEHIVEAYMFITDPSAEKIILMGLWDAKVFFVGFF